MQENISSIFLSKAKDTSAFSLSPMINTLSELLTGEKVTSYIADSIFTLFDFIVSTTQLESICSDHCETIKSICITLLHCKFEAVEKGIDDFVVIKLYNVFLIVNNRYYFTYSLKYSHFLLI